MNEKRYRLRPTRLTASLPASWLSFRTTTELTPHAGMIGQDRALRALEVGLEIPTRGFNVFAVGEAGAGKTSTLERLLARLAECGPRSKDLCYVNNFQSPDRPRPLLLPAGKGRALAREMERVVGELERMVPRVLSDGAFGHIRAGILGETRSRAEELTRRASQEATRLGLRLEEDGGHLRVVPLVGGEPLAEEGLGDLSRAARRAIEKRVLEFQKHADAFGYARRQLERDHDDRLLAAEMRAVSPLVDELIGELAARYGRLAESLAEFFEEVRDHVVQNHRLFAADGERGDDEAGPEVESGSPTQDPRVLYRVNVVVDRSREAGAPVVFERVPSAANLCGCFEYRETAGGLVTDHTMLRSGALHQANGGYLLIQASDLLSHEGAWDCLKRALRHREVRVDEGVAGSELRPRLAGALKPGAVPLDVKVILIGNHEIYYLLKLEDEDFQRLFKILADFESTMPRTKGNVHRLARFLGKVCQEEGYLPLHRSGMTRVVEYASRRAEHQERLITRAGELIDLLAEANMFARGAKARAIRGQDVARALAEAEGRHGSVRDAVEREIREGTILIRTKGLALGQINGIALYEMASSAFGVPVRITARTYAGRRGVVNIDREVNLSGAVHDKGALILIGYLGGRYAQRRVLGFSASITFEQSYDEIDGDSASSAELYALLSSLSGCPIRQGVAVTGSVNQLGEVQPIGGVNEKIEGVFQVCKIHGLTGDQGVMIPTTNIKNLMLGREVLDAVRAGRFHIYAVATVDEGIAVLTGHPAGRRRRDGSWTAGSINDLVQRRLGSLAGVIQQAGGFRPDSSL